MQYERLYDINPSGTGASTTFQYGYFVDDNFEPYYGETFIILSYFKTMVHQLE